MKLAAFIIAALLMATISWLVRGFQDRIHVQELKKRPDELKKWYENQNQVTKQTLKRYIN